MFLRKDSFKGVMMKISGGQMLGFSGEYVFEH